MAGSDSEVRSIHDISGKMSRRSPETQQGDPRESLGWNGERAQGTVCIKELIKVPRMRQ